MSVCRTCFHDDGHDRHCPEGPVVRVARAGTERVPAGGAFHYPDPWRTYRLSRAAGVMR